MEPVDKEQFDFLGIFPLSDVKGIEPLVEKSKEGYLSRNGGYYENKTGIQCIEEREYCSRLLPLWGKKAFVVAERMLNCSCRIYYEIFCEALRSRKEADEVKLEQARICLEEDAQRVVGLLEDKDAGPSAIKLPLPGANPISRFIEADNKWILYDTVKSFPAVGHVINPLYGAELVGPFFKAIKGVGYSPVLFGMHDQESASILENSQVRDARLIMLSKDLANLPSKFCVIDDNLGSGATLAVLKKTFEKNGRKVATGSIEMSWSGYDQMKSGAREGGIFKSISIDFPTYRDTRHHTLAQRLIDALRQGGDFYLRELKAMGFHNKFISDDAILFNRGKTIASRYGYDFHDYLEKDSGFILSMDLMDRKVRYLENMPISKAIGIVADYETVNIIDLDRYRGMKPNLEIIDKILRIKKCRVGGGIKTKQDIKQLLDMGARKVIVGTYASEQLLEGFPRGKIVVAIDSTNRANGIKKDVPAEIKRFEKYCDEFQYVCVETDGKANGGDVENAIKYSKLTGNKFNCVGGIASKDEMTLLGRHNIGCVVGRALQENYYG